MAVVADATGKGNSAAALSSLAIGALRAARRAGAGLQEAARLADEAILTLDIQLYLTAVLGSLGCQRPSAALDQLRPSHPADPARRWACGRAADGDRTDPPGIRFTERDVPGSAALW